MHSFTFGRVFLFYLQAEEQRQVLGKEKDAATDLRHLLEEKETRLKQVEGAALDMERRLKEATDELSRWK